MVKNEGTHVRLPAELWDRIDRYRREHPELPSRPSAIKELIELAFAELDARGKRTNRRPGRAETKRKDDDPQQGSR
jgi:hypothetical protein